MKDIVRSVSIFYLFFSLLVGGWGDSAGRVRMTADEILKRMEENNVYKSSEIDGAFIITDRFGFRKKTFKLYSKGEDKVLIVFTNPEDEGQKILRIEGEIYLYFPGAEEIIHLQGSALRDSMLGSDFSYEDMTGEKEFRTLYDVLFVGEENVKGKECYRLHLTAKTGSAVYPVEELWISKQTFSLIRGRYYALSGRPLKELEVKEIKKIEGKFIPVHLIMRDLLKKDSKTELIIDRININIPVDEKLFSLEELSW